MSRTIFSIWLACRCLVMAGLFVLFCCGLHWMYYTMVFNDSPREWLESYKSHGLFGAIVFAPTWGLSMLSMWMH